MTDLDARIADALDAGDIAGACDLAAQLPKPDGYLAAMLEINRIVAEGMRKPVNAPELPKTVSVEYLDGGEFELIAETPGHVPPSVVEKLRRCHREAKDYVAAFGDAIKAQAEKHKVKPGAFRRYVTALEADKTEDAEAEANDLLRLLDGEEA